MNYLHRLGSLGLASETKIGYLLFCELGMPLPQQFAPENQVLRRQ